jgi:hypothetical protein
LLSVALAWLAQNGSFVSTSRGIGTQWLLVTPAAMLVFIGQQQRHHSGQFTRSFRVTMWLYIAASVVFAGVEALSLNGGAGRVLSNGVGNDIISGAFALISAAVAIMFFATGRRFDGVVERRFTRTLDRVRKFGTPSFVESKTTHRQPTTTSTSGPTPSEGELFGDLGEHPADRIYTAVARHYIDRTLIYVALACIVAAIGMNRLGWGEGRTAVIVKQEQAEKVARERQAQLDAMLRAGSSRPEALSTVGCGLRPLRRLRRRSNTLATSPRTPSSERISPATTGHGWAAVTVIRAAGSSIFSTA